MNEAVVIPMEHGLLLAAILFLIGLLGVLVRRNIILILMSLEIMLNACGLDSAPLSMRTLIVKCSLENCLTYDAR